MADVVTGARITSGEDRPPEEGRGSAVCNKRRLTESA